MSLYSLNFIVFLGAIWLLFQFTPDRWRWLVLLSSSIGFYALLQGPLLIAALVLVITVAYVVGRRIGADQSEARRRRWLWAGIVANVTILCCIKYASAVASMLLGPRATAAADARLFLTLGVSYFTLQAVGYLVDIFLKEISPENHLGRLALYLSFFPKLLQGPIERGADLLPQLKAPYECSRENMRDGVMLFAWGLFKKAAVANRLAPYVATVYNDVHAHSGVSLLLSTYMYSLQIYADFSGYTDMALGAALFFNIKLTQNFNAPYLSTSVADFWRRWHISFSRWILHYIFEPLQISWRTWKIHGTIAALLITFLFSGLWHGVAWGFVVWGLLHGIYLSAGIVWRACKPRVPNVLQLQRHGRLSRFIQVCVTFNLITFAWIFFRANTLGDAWYVVTHLLSGTAEYVKALLSHLWHLGEYAELLQPILVGMGKERFVLMLLSVAVLLIPAVLKNRLLLYQRPAWFRFGVYYLLFLAIALLSVYDDKGFVYFQF